jgi:hypothetical protein
MRKTCAACILAVLLLACVGTPAAAQCRPANSKDAIYTGTGLPPQATPRSTPAQNDPRSAFAGLNDPNRDTYDPGKPNYGARYGENYGGPGTTNEQASAFLGTPCGPPLTVTPPSSPVTLNPPPLVVTPPPIAYPQPPVIVAPPGAVDIHGMPVQPGTLVPTIPLPSLPAPQTLMVAPWNPAETNGTLH